MIVEHIVLHEGDEALFGSRGGFGRAHLAAEHGIFGIILVISAAESGAMLVHAVTVQAGDGCAVILLLLLVQLKEDALNAFFARRWAMPRLEDCDTCFYSDYYETRFPGSVTQWQYDRILHLAETSRYIILILGKNHAQACGKADLAGGSVEAFRSFLEQKTGKETQYIGG